MEKVKRNLSVTEEADGSWTVQTVGTGKELLYMLVTLSGEVGEKLGMSPLELGMTIAVQLAATEKPKTNFEIDLSRPGEDSSGPDVK